MDGSWWWCDEKDNVREMMSVVLREELCASLCQLICGHRSEEVADFLFCGIE